MPRKISVMCFLLILFITTALAEHMPVPVKVQYVLFLKILTFDRSLKERVGDDLVIGIAYATSSNRSVEVKDKFVQVIEESSIKAYNGIPIRYVPIDVDESPDLSAEIARQKVDLLYVTPLRKTEMETLEGLSREMQIMMLTGIPEAVESGLTVGIGSKKGKPQILINLPSARAKGIDFKAQLLKFASVIQ